MKGDASALCSAMGFLTIVLNQTYMFLNIAIALNLHLVILLSQTPRRHWELCYWAFSLGLPFVLNVPLLG